jgi:hypothetical protein
VSNHTSSVEQRIVADLLDEGVVERHIARMNASIGRDESGSSETWPTPFPGGTKPHADAGTAARFENAHSHGHQSTGRRFSVFSGVTSSPSAGPYATMERSPGKVKTTKKLSAAGTGFRPVLLERIARSGARMAQFEYRVLAGAAGFSGAFFQYGREGGWIV